VSAPRLVVVEDLDRLALEAAGRVAELAAAAVASGGELALALAGGNTPRALHAALAGPRFVSRVPWARVRVLFGDERCVPPDDPLSNYRMARETLLERVPVPASQVERIRGEDPPEAAARAYEAALRAAVGAPAGEVPRLDLALLGLGADGHTASLFPGCAALAARERLVAAVTDVHPPGPHRVTLTVPALAAARSLLFLVSGADKRPALAAALAGGDGPAARVMAAHGGAIVIADRAAAGG
jgi:6-phosphogluconolactonase